MASYAHYCLHELKLLPNQFEELDRETKAFIIASIDIRTEKEKKQMEEAKRETKRKK